MYFYYIVITDIFSHSCGHLQGGENKNTNTIIMRQNHSTVKTHIVLGFLTVE